MASNDQFRKDPNATLDYSVDWSRWLVEDDEITTSSWQFASGSALGTGLDIFSPTVTTIWLYGGTAGQWYRLTNRITTTAGRADDRTINIFVTER
jgi:hypothetical protein